MWTGLRNQAVWPNYEVVDFQASVSDWSIPRLCLLLLCTLSCPPCYYNLLHSYHTSSSAHLGVPRLQPIISVFQKSSFSHLGVSHLRPSIPTNHPILPLPSGSGSYCMPISPSILLALASCDSAKVDRSCFYVVSLCHHTSLVNPSPSYPVSLAHTSNKGRSATHWSTVSCRLSI